MRHTKTQTYKQTKMARQIDYVALRYLDKSTVLFVFSTYSPAEAKLLEFVIVHNGSKLHTRTKSDISLYLISCL